MVYFRYDGGFVTLAGAIVTRKGKSEIKWIQPLDHLRIAFEKREKENSGTRTTGSGREAGGYSEGPKRNDLCMLWEGFTYPTLLYSAYCIDGFCSPRARIIIMGYI